MPNYLTWKLRPEVLLSPNIPLPLHGMAPRVVMGDTWWNQTRQKAYESTAYHCVACGVWKMEAKGHQWLEGHELYAIDYEKGKMVYLETVPLCHYCHNYIHDGRLLHLLQQGMLPQSKYFAILNHGDEILKQVGLRRLTRNEREDALKEMIIRGRMAPWEKWRLVVGKKTYKPLYRSREEMEAANAYAKG